MQSTIECRIKSAQHALYSMMGAGLYSCNRVNPIVSKQLIDVYISPRLLHSLQAMIPNDTDIQLLETVYRTNPAYTPKYSYYGCIPSTCRGPFPSVLSFYNRILNQPKSAEHEIIGWQLAMKDLDSHSWIMMVR